MNLHLFIDTQAQCDLAHGATSEPTIAGLNRALERWMVYVYGAAVKYVP